MIMMMMMELITMEKVLYDSTARPGSARPGPAPPSPGPGPAPGRVTEKLKNSYNILINYLCVTDCQFTSLRK